MTLFVSYNLIHDKFMAIRVHNKNNWNASLLLLLQNINLHELPVKRVRRQNL